MSLAHCILARGDLARGGRCSADTDSVCFSGAITLCMVGESSTEAQPELPDPVAVLGGVPSLPGIGGHYVQSWALIWTLRSCKCPLTAETDSRNLGSAI